MSIRWNYKRQYCNRLWNIKSKSQKKNWNNQKNWLFGSTKKSWKKEIIIQWDQKAKATYRKELKEKEFVEQDEKRTSNEGKQKMVEKQE